MFPVSSMSVFSNMHHFVLVKSEELSTKSLGHLSCPPPNTNMVSPEKYPEVSPFVPPVRCDIVSQWYPVCSLAQISSPKVLLKKINNFDHISRMLQIYGIDIYWHLAHQISANNIVPTRGRGAISLHVSGHTWWPIGCKAKPKRGSLSIVKFHAAYKNSMFLVETSKSPWICLILTHVSTQFRPFVIFIVFWWFWGHLFLRLRVTTVPSEYHWINYCYLRNFHVAFTQWRHRWGTPEESPAAPRSRVPTPHDTAWVCSSLEPCLTLAITLATSKGLSMSSDLLMRVHERSAYRCRGSLRDGGSQVLLTTAKLCFASGMFHGCDRSSTANMFTEKNNKMPKC